MRKILLFISILYISGCASDKKGANENNTINEDTVITDENLSSTSEIQNNQKEVITDSIETLDTVKTTNESLIVKEIKEKINDPEEIVEKKSIVQEKVVKEVTKPIVEKIRPDHTTWDQLTRKYVSSSGKVNYKGFKSDMSSINAYLSHLDEVVPQKDWTKNEKLAYWFNLYNAATIQMVSNAYPIKSIKDLNSGKPWDKKFIKSGGKTYSLNQIENTIVRPNYNEPRLHVAFNCAAVSCPKLSNTAFIPSKLNSQLHTLSKAWVNDSSKNKITENSIEVSKIFEWYSVDFKEGTIPFINKYINNKITDVTEIKYLEYNWGLND